MWPEPNRSTFRGPCTPQLSSEHQNSLTYSPDSVDHLQALDPPVQPPLLPPLRDNQSTHQVYTLQRKDGDNASLPYVRRPDSLNHGPPPDFYATYDSEEHKDDQKLPPFFNKGWVQTMTESRQLPPLPRPQSMAHFHQHDASLQDYSSSHAVPVRYIQSATTNAKQKAPRASQACETCRQLKAKCDEQRPCKICKVKSLPCTYRELPTKSLDKGSADILELFTSFKDEIATLAGHNKSLECLLERMQRKQQGNYDVISTNNEQQALPRSRDDLEKKMSLENAVKLVEERVPDDVEQNPGPPVEPGQSSLPAHHTARAGLLLQWPFINTLTKDILKKSVDGLDDFPFSQEQWYSNLRLGGEGERHVPSSMLKGKVSQNMTDIKVEEPPGAIAYSEASQSSDGDRWTGRKPWVMVGAGPKDASNTPKDSMLYAMGVPDFDPTTVRKHVQGFKNNMLNMHPILLPSEVDDLATEFLSFLSRTAESAPSSRAGFSRSVGTETTESRLRMGSKRKWPSIFEEENAESYKSGAFIPRSVSSALALSILALGKVCLHKTRIPDLVSEFDALTQPDSQLLCKDGSTSCPFQGSPPKPLSVQACDPSLPREADHMISRRVSPRGSEKPSSSRYIMACMDAIPGLEYHSLAADVFGSQLAGSSLKHVYVALFLGLYQGQLGCVMESWSYIALAGRTLQVVLRPSLSRLRQLKEENQVPQSDRDNHLAFAFWTCFQLESDILAEFSMPQSGILTYEDAVPFPNLTEQMNLGHTQTILTSYQAQLYARKQLNKVYNQLYSLDLPGGVSEMEAITQRLEVILDKGKWVPAEFQFRDSDNPAQDFLAARLRAKHWGAQAILYRKYIHMILHRDCSSQSMRYNWSLYKIDDEQSFRIPLGMNPQALNFARLGISALVQSTKAFHGLERGHRILDTSIFTTAHSQWGNLLVLSACYKHQVLQQFIDTPTLKDLFIRTMDMFNMIAHFGSSLRTDLKILKGLFKKLGFSTNDH